MLFGLDMGRIQRALFVLVTAFALGVARDAAACTCMESGPPCQTFFDTPAVFVGTVRNVTVMPGVPEIMANVRVEFEDVIGHRGIEGPTQTVMTGAAGGGSCAYPFKQGERYLVYGYRSKPGEPLRTSICSRTRRVAEAAEDLRFFNSLQDPSAGARVSGVVAHIEPGTISHDRREYGPVPNVIVTLRNDSAVYSTVTDARGRYELRGLPPATYELIAEPPEALVSNQPLKQTITLANTYSCAEHNLVLRFDGRVRGSIRNAAGVPAAGVRVQLMRLEYVDSASLVETIDATTDAGGLFEFSSVTPARYVLGVDILKQSHLPPSPDGVFAPTYHPGTPHPSSATIIDLQGGERHDLAPMTLPPALRAYRLTGIVKFEDGTPAAGAMVTLDDPVRKWLDLAEPIETDATGTFSFVVHEGLSYIVSASHRPRDTRGVRPIVTSVGPFVVSSRPPEPLQLVVTPSR